MSDAKDNLSTVVTQSPTGAAVVAATSTTQSLVAQPAPDYGPPKYLQGIAEWATLILGLAALAALVTRLMTKDVARDVKELRHDFNNQRGRVDQLERQDRDHDIRLAKVEQAMESFKEGQQRIEATIKDNHREQMETTKTIFDQVSTSIREVRDVKPRN